MQNEIPPKYVYTCRSTTQEEAQRSGFLHKVHPRGCKENASGPNATEEVCLCNCGDKIRVRFWMFWTYYSRRRTGDFNQEKRSEKKGWTSRAKEFESPREDKSPKKAYALLRQCSGKMKRFSPDC
ncbi:hypothetical protein RB195_008298 [Necator americanus]|uniref:Uncharacterized protein n=1 Tax=Necator americanus TaxID=51031 RepID=A0ABR1CMZ1_NECAM